MILENYEKALHYRTMIGAIDEAERNGHEVVWPYRWTRHPSLVVTCYLVLDCRDGTIACSTNEFDIAISERDRLNREYLESNED
jgi:hypothetical protein